jgi:hypothetical protein
MFCALQIPQNVTRSAGCAWPPFDQEGVTTVHAPTPPLRVWLAALSCLAAFAMLSLPRPSLGSSPLPGLARGRFALISDGPNVRAFPRRIDGARSIDMGWRWVPATVSVVDATGSWAWHAAIADAIDNWNRAGVISMSLSTGPCELAYRRITFCLGNLPGMTAGTTISPPQPGPLEFVQITSRPWQSWLRMRKIACHELGHAIGLGHDVPPTSSCMAPVLNWAGVSPSQEDYALLATMYP